MKYKYELIKEDYVKYLHFSDYTKYTNKGLIHNILYQLGKSKRNKRFKDYVDKNIRRDLLGPRELTIKKGVIGINDMRIERILTPNDIEDIYVNKNYIYIILNGASQSFIIRNNNETLLASHFNNNKFKTTIM